MESYFVSISSSGLPYRTEKILTRERSAFPTMISGLASLQKGEPVPVELSSHILGQALSSEDDLQAYHAAFIIGRISFQDDRTNEVLLSDLEKASLSEGRSDVAIECAMSLVLKGRMDRGKKMLKKLVSSGKDLDNQYKAAFYLAQLGDLSGFKAFYEALESDIPHYRLLAMRHLIAFEPFDGTTVDGMDIDVRTFMMRFLDDPDDTVRSEVPFYLEELDFTDLQGILEKTMEKDPSSLVRNAAQMVLERNQGK